MYVNLKILEKCGVDFNSIMILNIIKQNSNGAQEEFLKRLSVDWELIKDYIEFTKKGASNESKVRLNKKGKELLIKLVTSSVDEDTEKIAEWVKKVYKKKNNGIVKNYKELCRRISWFSDITNIKQNELALLIQSFISNTYDPDCGMSIEEAKKNNPFLVLSNIAENVFWSQKDVFSKHYSLDDSPLWQFYEDNIDFFAKEFDKLKRKQNEN